ncbi:MAG: tRNA pseudouridine(38-40) synthase TruA [Acutalibacteraceae bacterium]
MRNILLRLRFIGTAYHGWQVQSNALSVQTALQDAVEAILGSREKVTGCSRTDSGVHANMYCCTLQTESSISCFRLIAALNAKLPLDISVYSAVEVPADFHPRYSCISKQYLYQIYNGSARNPFYEGRALHYHRPLDTAFLDAQAKDFLGTHKFTSFSNSREEVNGNIRTIRAASVVREGDLVTFSVEADGFLYNMVRIMAGTLLFLAEGKREPGSIPDILAREDRRAAGPTAPACGLYLNHVYYGGELDGE